MKKYLDWIVLFILSLIFITTWPILLIIIGVKTLFGKKSSDSEKIDGAKMAILTLIGIITVSIIIIYEYPLKILFSRFPLNSLFVLLISGLIVLVILQKIFPSMKWLKKKSDIS